MIYLGPANKESVCELWADTVNELDGFVKSHRISGRLVVQNQTLNVLHIPLEERFRLRRLGVSHVDWKRSLKIQQRILAAGKA